MKKLNILVLLLTMAMFIASCGSDSDDPKPPTTTTPTGETPPTKPSARDGNSNSDLRTGTFELNGNTFQTPGSLTNASGKHNVGKLTQTTKKSNGGKTAAGDEFAWLVDVVTVDGEQIEFLGDADLGLDVAFFFLEDGTYDIYDFPNDEWDWGYWYANDNATLLVFDPETEYEIIFDIASLNSTSMNLAITEDGSEYGIELNSYSENGGEATEDIDVSTIEGYFTSVFWELDGAGLYIDDEYTYLTTDELAVDITAYFSDDGEVFIASQDGDFDASTGVGATEIEIATYDVDISNFIVTFNYTDGTTEELYLIYVDGEEMVLAQEEDGQYIEFVFTALDLASFEEFLANDDFTWAQWGTYDAEGVLSQSQQEVFEVSFNTDGTFSTFDGINEVSGTYTVNGDGGGVIVSLDDAGTVTEAIVLFYNVNNMVVEVDGEIILLW